MLLPLQIPPALRSMQPLPYDAVEDAVLASWKLWTSDNAGFLIDKLSPSHLNSTYALANVPLAPSTLSAFNECSSITSKVCSSS